ncbi:hypothetical protein CDD83_7802 [Cordyceps sp. RAO-2017]|nr:hypothetical protein CDD83_7802 [Cordyceps sp. RAO-2017]
MAGPAFDITPEKQAGFLHFMRQQLGFRPQAVTGVDLEGQTAIVTGSNCGVGLETSRQLLDLGLSRLILAVRNEDKGRAAAEELAAGRDPPLREGAVEVWKLDLDSYDSVVAFADRARALGRLDVAVLNAGLCPAKRLVNERTGHDEIIQVNYLSTALLAVLLLPVARAGRPRQQAPTRITLTLSETAAWAKFKVGKDVPVLGALDAPAADYDPVDRMFVSKLLGQFFVAGLARRVPPSVAVINAASPGSIHDSQFNRDIDQTFAGAIIKRVLRLVGNSSAVGARMMTDAAVRQGEDTHGQFLSFQKMVPMAPIVYTDEGKRISEEIWKETMKELSFANPEALIAEVGS